MTFLLGLGTGIVIGVSGVLTLALFARKETRTVEDLRERANELSKNNKIKTGL